MIRLPLSLQEEIVSFLSTKFSVNISIEAFEAASGGCINVGGTLRTSYGNFFVKWNSVSKYPHMFEAEAKGLALLASSDSLITPSVIGVTHDHIYQAIILSLVDDDTPAKDFCEQLGRGLAKIHTKTNRHFGLDHDNYIGSLTQSNDEQISWVDFFIEKRLHYQLQLISHAELKYDLLKKFETLFRKLPELLVSEKPSLLHGDLWQGNVITCKGQPCLINPAVYFGNREIDIAMTQLFSGFESSFLRYYEEVFPLHPGWRERIDLYNLYPLLVHLNLFGSGYLPQIHAILKRFQ